MGVRTFTFFLFVSFAALAHAQTDAILYEEVSIPNEEFAEYHFDSTLQTDILWYNYSGIWDIDGDRMKDSIWFIGNGGAHQYFRFRMILSSEKEVREYTSIEIDMPYLQKTSDPQGLGEASAVQCAVGDFDSDGTDEIYFNINNPFVMHTKGWRALGVSTPYFILDHSKEGVTFTDY